MRFWRTVAAAVTSQDTRERIILRGVDKVSPGLEIGPSHRPVAAQRDGFNVRISEG